MNQCGLLQKQHLSLATNGAILLPRKQTAKKSGVNSSDIDAGEQSEWGEEP